MLLEKLRQKIDAIDFEIIKLINQRMEHTLLTRKLKATVLDLAREQEVLAGIKRRSTALVRTDFSERIYKEIINESKLLQKQELKLTGFQGEHGAYSEVAINVLDHRLLPIPCTEFTDVFEGVITGQLDYGIVPVENSLEGAVTQVNDLLVETDAEKIKVIGEVRIPIRHCLLALPGTDYREIKVVYAHPQALAQCRRFLSEYKMEACPYYDGAGAAVMLSKEKPLASAVIASSICAELYNLEILFEDIADNDNNVTRFLLISNKENEQAGNKCSIVFSTAHKAGELFNVLKIFSEADLSLTRIESRPMRKDPGRYVFLLDFMGSAHEQKVINALEKVKEETIFFKFLGCYNEYIGTLRQ